ncbi:hypothetical protein BC936DRAFT_143655 [Jimgerdemannia flammicorona]|uniref:Macro-like domain-containing protein n=1 Tax=Jimgerdemannia flammicorona TaxID=994334 RepID=A0A433DDK9_9FUNG|nr:hypothetical protein BC936DRAFT_143655 [Jimgerdemannia flammicorona]
MATPYLLLVLHLTMAQESGSSSSDPPPWAFHIFLCDIKSKLCNEWKEEFTKTPLQQGNAPDAANQSRITYSIHETRIEELVQEVTAQCIMSPANGFGLMDGGVDMNLSEMYGGTAVMVPHWAGQQNTATCCIIDLDSLRTLLPDGSGLPRYLAHTPTMRTPKTLDPDDDLVYRSTWSILTSIRRHNMTLGAGDVRIDAVILMGLGTAVGRLPAKVCATQMAIACQHFIEAPANGNPDKDVNTSLGKYFRTWHYAFEIEAQVNDAVENGKREDTTARVTS